MSGLHDDDDNDEIKEEQDHLEKEEGFLIKQELLNPTHHYYDGDDDVDKKNEFVKCILCNNKHQSQEDSSDHHQINIKAIRWNFVMEFLLKQLQLNQEKFGSPPTFCSTCCVKLDQLIQLYNQLTALQNEFKRLKDQFVHNCLTFKGTKPNPRSASSYEQQLGRKAKVKSVSEGEETDDEHQPESEMDQDHHLVDIQPPSNSDSKSKSTTTITTTPCTRFSCHICPNKSFSRKHDLSRHLLKVHQLQLPTSRRNAVEEEIKCELCSKTFTTRNRLRIHVKTVHKYNHYKPLGCQYCPNRRFIFPVQLKRHTALVHGEGQVGVEVAGGQEGTNEPAGVEGTGTKTGGIFDPETEALHVQTLEESKRCKDCGVRFERGSDLRKHEREEYHGDARNNQCQYCGQGFTTKQALFNHLKHQHVARTPSQPPHSSSSGGDPQISSLDLDKGEPASSPPKNSKKFPSHLLCPYCSTQFSYKNTFDRHLATTHPVQYLANKPHLCAVCYRAFESVPLLQAHQSSAHYRCSAAPGCSKLFLSIRHLQKHEVAHTGIKSFTCAICGKSYTTLDNLIKHEKKFHP